jgi:UDP-glucose 4-epimerase
MVERVILVTGATGAVGPSVVSACQAAGLSVRTLSRHAAAAAVLPPAVDVRLGDVCDAQAIRSAAAGADVVVHLAALLHQFDGAPDVDRQYQRVNVEGTENVVKAAIEVGVSRLVLVSTIAVYGPSAGLLVNERTVPHPDTDYGRTKLAAEQAVLTATAGGRRIGTVLRAAATYGPRVKGNYRRLALAIARRRYVALGRNLNRRTLVRDRDLAQAIVLAAGHPAAAGVVFNVTDGRVHTLAEIVNAIHFALGRQPPRFYVPPAAARVGAMLCEGACRAVGLRPPLTRALLDKYTEDIAVDGTMIQRTLGFTPAVDLDAGWRETMAALKDAGEC